MLALQNTDRYSTPWNTAGENDPTEILPASVLAAELQRATADLVPPPVSRVPLVQAAIPPRPAAPARLPWAWFVGGLGTGLVLGALPSMVGLLLMATTR